MSSAKIGILVVGMHRSGTSAVARVLNLLGAQIPGNLMPPNAEINAKGFWESRDVASLNDSLFDAHDSRWDDVLPIPLDDLAQPAWQDFESAGATLLDRDFADARMFVLKDPRICRLLPYWTRLFERLSIQPRIIIPIRHPLEVAASLHRRDGFAEEKSIYLWLRHLIDTERASRDLPRSFLMFDEMLDDWRSTTTHIARDLALDWPNKPDAAASEIEAFLDSQLRHHRRDIQQLDGESPIQRWVRTLYLALQQRDPDLQALIDRIDTELAAVELMMSPLLKDDSRQLRKAAHELHQTRLWGSSLDTELINLKAALSDEQAQRLATQLELEQEQARLRKTQLELEQEQAQQQQTRTELQQAGERIAELQAGLDYARRAAHNAASQITRADQAVLTLSSSHPAMRRPFWKRGRDLRKLENTALFDAAYYLTCHPEVVASGMTPHEHYLRVGAAKRWDPHQLFSTAWYLDRNPDVRQSGLNPLLHFLRFGSREKRSPHPLFDTALYLGAHPDVQVSGMNPLEHYLEIGGLAGLRPHWLFDGQAYLDEHPEVRAAGSNPLLHYLRTGHLDNYRPHHAFDQVYYLSQVQEDDIGMAPLVHFIIKGARQHLNPNTHFDTAEFIELHPHLAHDEENPLVYHIRDVDHDAVFNPASRPAAAAVPSPVHNEIPGQPLPAFLDFLFDEFGETVQADIVARMQRFHLPFTSEKIAPKAGDDEINAWLEEIAALSHAQQNSDTPQVSIIIPVYNQLAFTLACIHSVLSSATRYSYEIIIADDCSTDRTTEIFTRGLGRIHHVRGEQNQGFIRNCNNAARHARGEYVVLLNNDTIVLPGWLDELIGTLEADPAIGLSGSKLLYPDGRLQEAGGIIFEDGSGWNYGRMDDPRKPHYCYMRDADYVSGASIALRTSFWHSVGGFDERYSVAYYEDTDMAFRVRQAGLRVVIQPLSQLLHFEGISSGTDLNSGTKRYQVTNGVTFREKWQDVLSGHGQCDSKRLPADRTATGRILVIDACTPTPDRDSGSMDTYQFLRIFKAMGLHVTFVPENLAHFGRYTRDLQRIGVETLYAPYWMSFHSLFEKLGHSYDLVLIYRAPVAAKLHKLVRKHAPQAKFIFDTVDLHFLREEREAELTGDERKARIAANLRKTELDLISSADASIVLSSHEMELLAKLTPRAKLHEVPIVREIPGRGPLGFEDRRDIVFIGGFRHAPNVDAVKWFIAEVWPHLKRKGYEGRFIIVGADVPPEIMRLREPGIEIRGFVPHIEDVFNHCRISVAPLRYGAGLKGKVISSLSMGVPVVATPVAVEGGGFADGKNVLVADAPEAMAEAILRLYHDAELWEQLSREGISHCETSFSVKAVSLLLYRMIDDLAPNLTLNKKTPHAE